jgi:[protein-PII] uridylyltransferase
VADIRAVGPGVWNAWKGQLMRELYAATEAVFRGERGADPASAFRRRRAEAAAQARAVLAAAEPELARFAAPLDDGYFTEFGPEDQRAHARLIAAAADGPAGAAAAVKLRPERNATEAVVAAADRPGLFADLAAALAAEGAEVLGARLNAAGEGQVLDVFQLQDATGAPWGARHPAAWARLAARLEAVASGAAPAPPPMKPRRAGEQEITPVVATDAESSGEAAIIEVSGRDRPGLLASLARALAEAGLSVTSAHVGGSGPRVADAFYVTEPDGTKPDAARLEAAKAALLDVLRLAPAGGAH